MALIAHWPLNGNTNDISGFGNHGSIYGTLTSSTAGKIGLTYIFENNDNGVDISNNNFSGLTSYTMSAWINPAGNHRNYNGTILSSGNWNGTSWAFGVNQTNTAIDVAGRGYNKYIDYTFTLNKWTHILSVVSNGVSKVYVNGSYLGQRNVTSTLASDATNTFIGRETYEGGHFSFNGKINDVRIYDHALTDVEIQELHRTKILHYDFNNPNIEPTINLFSHREPRIDPTYAKYTYTTNGTWLNKHPNAIRVYSRETNGEITGFVNGGVSDPTNSYHAVWEYDDYLKKPVVVQNDVDGSWKAYSFGIGKSMNGLGLSVGDYYTISWDQWVDDLGKETWGFLYGQNGSGTNGFHDSIVKSRLRNTSTRTWQRMYATFQVSSNWNLSANLTLYLYGYNKRGVIKMANIQMEAKDHPTPFVWNSRSASQINDISGFNNHGEQTGNIAVINDSPLRDNSIRFNSGTTEVGRSLYYPDNITISTWFKSNQNGQGNFHIPISLGSTNVEISVTNSGQLRYGFLISGTRRVYEAPANLLDNQWHLLTSTYDGTTMKGYVDGVLLHQATHIGTLPTGNAGMGIGRFLGSSTYGLNGFVSDPRIYATSLTDKEIKDLYDDRAEILNSGTLQTYDFKQRRNLLQSVNQAIKDKQFKDGLSSYTQGNTSVTLTDNGYRIYRTPNVNPTDNGNTMWGGLRINMADIPGGIPLTKGRSYRLIINTNGKTSNPANGSSKFTNSMGWGGGGLNPTPITIGREWVQIPSNFNGKHDIIWEFKIEDDIYKVCTSSYSSFIAGNTYPSYNHLQLGWGYQNTGSEGTEIYITGIHLYDITDDDTIGISKKGIGIFDEYSTVGITEGLIGYWDFKNGDLRDYSGSNYIMEPYNSTSMPDVEKDGLVFDGSHGLKIENLVSDISQKPFSFVIDLEVYSNESKRIAMGYPANTLELGTTQGIPTLTSKDSGGWTTASSGNKLVNERFLYTGTFDGNQIIVYQNAEHKADFNGHKNDVSLSDHLLLGNWTSMTQGFIGKMYSIKVFNRALSPEEVKLEYNTMFNNEVQIHESGVLYAKDIIQY